MAVGAAGGWTLVCSPGRPLADFPSSPLGFFPDLLLFLQTVADAPKDVLQPRRDIDPRTHSAGDTDVVCEVRTGELLRPDTVSVRAHRRRKRRHMPVVQSSTCRLDLAFFSEANWSEAPLPANLDLNLCVT